MEKGQSGKISSLISVHITMQKLVTKWPPLAWQFAHNSYAMLFIFVKKQIGRKHFLPKAEFHISITFTKVLKNPHNSMNFAHARSHEFQYLKASVCHF